MGEFEKKLERLKEIVTLLEQEDLSLEKGVALFEEGVKLIKFCREQLEEAKHKVEVFMNGILKEFKEEEEDDDFREEEKI